MIFENWPLFALHDANPEGGMKPVLTRAQAYQLNEEGYGIHWCPNDFEGRRLEANVTKINAWYMEIDDVPKAEQWQRLTNSPVPASMVVESKNSVHAYWFARGASVENFREVQERLIYFFGADSKKKAPNGTMRAAGFYHAKDFNDPYFVELVDYDETTYTEEIMSHWFAAPPAPETPEYQPGSLSADGTDFAEKVYNLDCVEMLQRLSGTGYVGGQSYTFKPQHNGNVNVWVDGKGTSVFVDKSGKIGGGNKAGPTIWRWLQYFGHDNAQIFQILKQVAPEVFS